MNWLDTSHAKRSLRVLSSPQSYQDVKRSIAFYNNKPDATAALHSVVFEWKITHNKTVSQQFSALCMQALDRAFAFATNYAWLPSVDVFFVLSGPEAYIGHILVTRDQQNQLKSTMSFFDSLTVFYRTLRGASERVEDVVGSACGALLGVFNHLQIAPSMLRVRRTTEHTSKHVYSVALPERHVKGYSPAVFTHDFRLCLKAMPLSTFMVEKDNIQKVFASSNVKNDVAVPYALIAVFNKESGMVFEPLHPDGENMLKHLLRVSRKLCTVEYNGCDTPIGLRAVEVPEGWGVLVMLHGATMYSTKDKVSHCITLHSAIVERLNLGCEVLQLLDHIKRTLEWQASQQLMSCDLRPPNVVAFTRALLDLAKSDQPTEEEMQLLNLDGDEEEHDWKTWLKSNEGKTKAFAGSFPCEMRPFVWTLIDYGLCLDNGCANIPEGAAWDLIKLVVGGYSGKRENLSMSPNEGMYMLSAAMYQLSHSIQNDK
jgi:hypothetical protein